MGYHKRPIKVKGVLGEFSKVEEELDEFREAKEQNNRILAMCELADLYGAMKHFFRKAWDLDIKDVPDTDLSWVGPEYINVELYNIYKALEADAAYFDLTIEDLRIMSDATESAFLDGTR